MDVKIEIPYKPCQRLSMEALARCCAPNCDSRRDESVSRYHCTYHSSLAKKDHREYKRLTEKALHLSHATSIYRTLQLYTVLEREVELRLKFRQNYFTPHYYDYGHDLAIELRRTWLRQCEERLEKYFSLPSLEREESETSRDEEQAPIPDVREYRIVQKKIRKYTQEVDLIDLEMEQSRRAVGIEVEVIRRIIRQKIASLSFPEIIEMKRLVEIRSRCKQDMGDGIQRGVGIKRFEQRVLTQDLISTILSCTWMSRSWFDLKPFSANGVEVTRIGSLDEMLHNLSYQDPLVAAHFRKHIATIIHDLDFERLFSLCRVEHCHLNIVGEKMGESLKIAVVAFKDTQKMWGCRRTIQQRAYGW